MFTLRLKAQEIESLGGARVLLSRALGQPVGMMSPLQRYQVLAEPLSTAEEAYAVGIRLAHALLWAAVSKKFRLRVESSHGSPCRVEQVRGGVLAFGGHGYARISWPLNVAEFGDLLRPVLERDQPIDPRVGLSLELFASARLEISVRARFIALVSALEPLVDPLELGSMVSDLVQKFLNELSNTPALPTAVRASLCGRIEHLRKESIRMALRRLKDLTPEIPSAFEELDEAYALRSQMLHDGLVPENLDARLNRLEGLMRVLYSRILGHPLLTATQAFAPPPRTAVHQSR